VEVKGRFALGNPSNMERDHYVKLDIGILNHCFAGGIAGIRRNRWNGRVDRAGALRDLYRAVPGIVDLPSQGGLKT
jgi:uncharacterized protein (DUF1015 family)